MRAKQYIQCELPQLKHTYIEKDTYLRSRRAMTTISGKYVNAINMLMLRNSSYDRQLNLIDN